MNKDVIYNEQSDNKSFNNKRFEDDKILKIEKGFIPFITCGDPNLDVTEELIYALAEENVSLIELGIPFSDPTAEGPVIQMASQRALLSGTTTDKIFDMVERVRKNTDIPLVFMTYANVVYSYGTERFLEKSAELDIYGIILPDVPFEEKEEFAPMCSKYGIKFISLIAPTSEQRIEMIASQAEGFIYCVSSMGVTGVRNSFAANIKEVVKKIKGCTDIPVAVGFGVSRPEHVASIHEYADAAIVGSAIVSICGEYKEKCVPKVIEYVREMTELLLKT
ncbi:MAG: tryptophan synthase subunit alpha [Lachnospira sp.]